MYNIAKINNSGTFFGLEQFKKIITEKFDTCIDFFVRNVVLVLNKLKDSRYIKRLFF
jgi:hypothetical protein